MTDEQINQRIAEACGWWGNCKENCMRPPNCTDMYCEIPNYCHDLNAMHEAEATLDEDCRNGFRLELLNVTDSKHFGDFKHIHATARQRAEALLRTLDKWEEAQK